MFDNLRTRLIASYVIIILVTVALAGAAFYFLVGGYRKQISESTLQQAAAPTAFQLAQLRRPAEARPLILFLAEQAQGQGVGAVVINSEGVVVVDATDNPAQLLGDTIDIPAVESLPQRVNQLYQGEHKTRDGQTLDFIVIPMPDLTQNRPNAVGGLVLYLPRESAADLVREELAPRLLLATGAGLFAAIIVGGVFARWLYRPLSRLRKAAASVSDGDYASRVDVTGPRETRDLANDFNLMTEEIAQGRAALREFLIDTSHELRTPLTSIRGFSQAIIDGTIDDEQGRIRAGEVIQRETDRLLRLVAQLSDLARLESGEARFSFESVDVMEIIRDAVELFEPLAEASSVRLEASPAPAPPPVRADRDRVEQVLSNLIDNALRHTPSGGDVRISAQATEGVVEVAVADTGPGIPTPELPRVFDRFYRGTRGNSGLGLAICRELVRAHGGEIRAESVEGLGARFVFTLPVSPGETATATPS